MTWSLASYTARGARGFGVLRTDGALVETVHKRGLFAETHSTNPEPLRVSVLAGIDLIQHPEVHSVPIPDDLVAFSENLRLRGSYHQSLRRRGWRDSHTSSQAIPWDSVPPSLRSTTIPSAVARRNGRASYGKRRGGTHPARNAMGAADG